MTAADVDKLLEDMEEVSRDLQDKATEDDDNYNDTLDLITTLSEQLSLIYLSE